MTTITVMVTLTYPDPDQPPDLEEIEALVENYLNWEGLEKGKFKGCSQIEAEVEHDAE